MRSRSAGVTAIRSGLPSIQADTSRTTWAPIFDGESAYSIGCITLDPANPEVV